MKQQEVFKKIGIIIKELNEQYDYLNANENELNDLELELFVANAHFLADHSEVLRKLHSQNMQAPKPEPVKEERYFEPVVQPAKPENQTEPVTESPAEKQPGSFTPVSSEIDAEENPVPHIDLRGDDTGTDYSYIRQEEPAQVKHELKLDIPDWADDEIETPVEKVVQQEEKKEIAEMPAIEPQKEPERVAAEIKQPEPKKEDIKEEPLTINQRISAQLNNTANRTEQLHTQPITDLKQAITLNDKLLYIKDLFNGYNLAYSEAIDIVNRFNSFDEADKFLQSSYAVKNNWSSKQSTVDKFYNLLRRRFSI